MTDEQDLEIVDVGSGPSGPDSEVDWSYQTLLTSDIEPDVDLPTPGLSMSAAYILPLTGSIFDKTTALPAGDWTH